MKKLFIFIIFLFLFSTFCRAEDKENIKMKNIQLFGVTFDMSYDEVIENGLKRGYTVAASYIPNKYSNRLKKLDEFVGLFLIKIYPYIDMDEDIFNNVKLFNDTPSLYEKFNEFKFEGIQYYKDEMLAFCAYFIKDGNNTNLICMETGEEDKDFYKVLYVYLEKIYGKPISTGPYNNIDFIWRSGNDVLMIYHDFDRELGPVFSYSIPLMNKYVKTISDFVTKR